MSRLDLPRPDLYRGVIAVMMVCVLFLALNWLQSRFNSADHKKATQIVQEYRTAPKGPTISEQLLARHPGRQAHHILWSSELMNSCLGYVRVTAKIMDKGAQPAQIYAFDVDLMGPSIHPTDKRTIEVLKSLESHAQ